MIKAVAKVKGIDLGDIFYLFFPDRIDQVRAIPELFHQQCPVVLSGNKPEFIKAHLYFQCSRGVDIRANIFSHCLWQVRHSFFHR